MNKMAILAKGKPLTLFQPRPREKSLAKSPFVFDTISLISSSVISFTLVHGSLETVAVGAGALAVTVTYLMGSSSGVGQVS